MPRERIVFVTGKLAEYSLRQVAEKLADEIGFDAQVAVLPISVAALMQTDWVARKLTLDDPPNRVVLPGWCQGDLDGLAQRFGVPFERGPKDLHALPEYFGRASQRPALDRYDIEIIAEINHAPRLEEREILRLAAILRDDGADVIDLGCVPGESWGRCGEVTRLLRSEGFRISIDSFERTEVEAAVAAGAELVLSCHQENVDWAARLGVEVVAIPQPVGDESSLGRTIEALHAAGATFRIDPIVEPIGTRFAQSLGRYLRARERWPNVEIMMGVGNVTELVDVDSAGVNVVLAGFCQDLGIRSVLTTQVINWARSSVKELDLARRLVWHSRTHGVLPKHLEPRLVILRDPQVLEMSGEEIARLAAGITDPNYRIFVQDGTLHLINRDGHWQGDDAFELFRSALAAGGRVDPEHAFYLGYELSKAATARTLGKTYTQDEALCWGFLTVPESHHVGKRSRPAPSAPARPADGDPKSESP